MKESNLERKDSKVSLSSEFNGFYSPLPLTNRSSEAENSTPQTSYGKRPGLVVYNIFISSFLN